MTFVLQKRLVEYLKSEAQAFSVADLRIGLGYTAVRLNDGHGGVAWTPQSDSQSCTHVPQAGTLSGRPAEELLSLLVNEGSAIGASHWTGDGKRAAGRTAPTGVLARRGDRQSQHDP